jgi:hypothetical protein
MRRRLKPRTARSPFRSTLFSSQSPTPLPFACRQERISAALPPIDYSRLKSYIAIKINTKNVISKEYPVKLR